MTDGQGRLIDKADENRFEQDFESDGGAGQVWADYAVRGDTRMILHVEADQALRGSGAAGRFMQALAEHARESGDEAVSAVQLCGRVAQAPSRLRRRAGLTFH